MMIRLRCTLPVEVRHGCITGTTWEVETIVTGTRAANCPRYVFRAEAGQLVTALYYEATVTSALPEPPCISYKEHYGTPEPKSVFEIAAEAVAEDEDEDAPFTPVFKPQRSGRKRC